MTSAALQQLATVSGATTLAVLLVALARAPLRGMIGARAAYWLWLAVPASAIAWVLPRAAPPSGAAAALAQGFFVWLWTGLDRLISAIGVSDRLGTAAFALWAVGALAALASTVARQRAFARSLGCLVQWPDGTWRSHGVAEPMLVGALRPRILVPLDFERRFTAEEREFVLAHERAHIRRGDAVVNAVGAVWLCVFWFNPVMPWAMRLLRLDQDLACDAWVLAGEGNSRRGRYAGALLKAQLSGEWTPSLPLACHWRSAHPLRRRICALRRPVAGRMRHGLGVLLVSALVACASFGARAVQPAFRRLRPAVPHATATTAYAADVHPSGKVCPLTRRAARARSQAQTRG
ncbi:MAG TPA: M56 family metallopeptidase [Steroidobacteraceae bacterium]|nr:M56 family metallopeptidase [Steroidobacteraceae bacterium]